MVLSMDILAIIPARGGSKRVPRKNLMPLAGKPLIVHSVEQAVAAQCVGSVVVSTDDDDIAAVSQAAGAAIVRRPPALSTDQASSESALLHVLDERAGRGLGDPDLVVFLQCTSPVRRPGDIDGAVRTLLDQGADSLLTASENKRFIWGIRDGQPFPYNYDYRRRKREQDLEPQFQENGSIYVFKPWVLRQQDNRLGGRMAIHEMDYWSSFQIDTPEDVELIEWIMGKRER